MSRARVVIEADGGSRGNPGPAAYGSVLRDADTGEVIAEDGRVIGETTNNVAEYRGLIGGLRLAAEHAPGAAVEVRMDSKLVVEQMSGRWRIKHADMRDLAQEAQRLAPASTVYTWIPREQNGHADRLVNEALDGRRSGVAAHVGEDALVPRAAVAAPLHRPGGPVTTLLLMRHGVTAHTTGNAFSSGMGGENPPLSDEGRRQAELTAEWLRPVADRIDVVVHSPVRRTAETAEIAARILGKELVVDPSFAEMEFGHWDGLTYPEVAERYPEEMRRWIASLEVAPEGGESFAQVRARVLAGLDVLLEQHHGRTVLLVSHVNPIKSVLSHALGADIETFRHVLLDPTSISIVSYYDEDADPFDTDTTRPGRVGANIAGRSQVRGMNLLPPGRDFLRVSAPSW